jgi:hypothetical protein
MMTCCTFDSSLINLTYSEQQVFSHSVITLNFASLYRMSWRQTTSRPTRIESVLFSPFQISNLETELSDGLKLISLIEVLSGKRMPKHNKKPTFRDQSYKTFFAAPTRANIETICYYTSLFIMFYFLFNFQMCSLS